jgi:hypothetical protein
VDEEVRVSLEDKKRSELDWGNENSEQMSIYTPERVVLISIPSSRNPMGFKVGSKNKKDVTGNKTDWQR